MVMSLASLFPVAVLEAQGSPAWQTLQRQDQVVWTSMPLPTLQDEDWKYFDLRPLRDVTYVSVSDSQAPIALRVEPSALRLYWNQGRLQLPAALPDGIILRPLAPQARSASRLDQDYFFRMNQSFFPEAYELRIQKSFHAKDPIYLESTLEGSPQNMGLAFSRLHIVVESGVDVQIVERFKGSHAYHLVSVVTLEIEKEAQMDFERLHYDASVAFHFSYLQARVGRGARLGVRTVGLGSRLRRDIPDIFLEEAASVELDGLCLLRDQQLGDTHSFIHHAHPHAQSRQLHKCIVQDHSKGIFNGQILVALNAQQTDAQQESRNLILGDHASIDTKPQLEIYADDVKCAHGATIGQLDLDELFYLQSRGFSETAARGLLTFAFASDLLGRIRVPVLQKALKQEVIHRLQMDILGELS